MYKINEETTLDSLDQLRQAQILSDNYFRISRENASDDPIAKVMAQAQQDAEQYDPELVRYALMVWVVHDPEARRRNLKIPPLGQRAPHITVPKLVNAVAEDPQLNEHHERWHIVFPAFPVNGVSKDREGENFAFMHRQMLARYDVERIAVGLQPVKAFSDYSEHIPESYNPDSDLVYDPNDDSNATILHFTPTTYRFGQQLYDGIEGKGEVTFGQDDESANRYGNILETTLHNTGHVMLAYIMTPNGANSQNTPPGVMVDPRTACRDPVFGDGIVTLTTSSDIILAWKDKLLGLDKNGNADSWLSYAQNAFGNANFDADVSSNPVVTDELQTEMKTRNFIWTEDDNIQNTTNKNVDITIRVFLAPEELINSRVRWIELDKIRQTLKPNEKAVFSQNCDESVVIRKPAQKTPEQMDTTAITIEKRLETESLSEDQQSEAYFCDCGWPFATRLSFCGSQQWDESYPDARRMGYPFDKPFKNDSFEQTFAGLKNVAVRNVTLRWSTVSPKFNINF
ncbi:hypothetical protein C2G38_2197593 [Gigaspora rosea]|uniref:Hemocyanin middle domain-containing protein n=1 Tax=Gigaspora rosea TaxID=44941 RepID=A0A397UVA2_9GLOM|nr:hypothetical protein C2G38_2197593 [Gigaspora rosea]